MGVPIEKKIENVQKALLTRILDKGKSFDPNNPNDVRKQEEIKKQVEAMQSIASLVTGPTGGGLVGMARGISKNALAKISKTKFAQNKVKQIVTSTARKKSKEVGGFKIGESAIETSKASKVVPKTTPTVTPTVTPKVDALTPTIPTRVPSLRGYTPEEAKQVMKDIVSKNKGKENKVAARRSLEGKIISLIAQKETGFRASVKESIGESNKKAAMTIGALTGLLGAGAGTTYYGMQLSNKDNKQTTNTQKTGPVDLKRIDKSKLKPSKVEGVYITSALVDGQMKDFGIKWNNATKSWDYYRGDNKPTVPKTIKEDTESGGVTPITNDRNKGTGTGGGGNQTKTTGGGGGTKTPVKPTVTTTPLMGDEYYKKNPSLATLRQQDDDKQLLARAEAQKKEMMEFKPTEVLPTKPLSSLVFKTSPTVTANNLKRDKLDESDALYSIKGDNLLRNKLPLKKKKYGGNLAMLKYMK